LAIPANVAESRSRLGSPAYVAISVSVQWACSIRSGRRSERTGKWRRGRRWTTPGSVRAAPRRIRTLESWRVVTSFVSSASRRGATTQAGDSLRNWFVRCAGHRTLCLFLLQCLAARSTTWKEISSSSRRWY